MIDPTQPRFKDAKRIVVKIGSALVVDNATAAPRAAWLASVAADIAALRARGWKWWWYPPVPLLWRGRLWASRVGVLGWKKNKPPLRWGKSAWPAPGKKRWPRMG
jgi:hypothetical protein